MYQMKEAFENDLKIPVSVLGDGQFGHINAAGQQAVKKMSVGMVQTLISRLEITSPEKEFERLYNAAARKHEKEIEQLRLRLKKEKKSPEFIARAVANTVDGQEKKLKAAKTHMGVVAERKAMEQTAIRAQTINLLEKFEFVILEEAHEASGNGYFEILKYCKNAHYRLALTATPFMKEDEEANMKLMASSGPIAIKVTEKMLIDRGILAKPYFKIVRLQTTPDKLRRSTAWQAAYRLGIVENAERNRLIVEHVQKGASCGLSVMVLVQHKKHGQDILELLQSRGIRCEFIQGEDNQAERKQALYKLASGQIDALIGTTILDVGVDVPAVGMIVLAGGGKAEVALRQRIGRGLRAKKHGPNIALIVDFDDPHNSHLRTHALQRLNIIKETEGFCENIVVGDFKYEALGLVKKAA